MALDVATSLAAWFANTQNSDGQATINSEKRRQKKQSTLHLTFEQRTTLITSILHAIKPNQLSLNTKLYQIESTIDNTCILNCKKNGNDVEFRCKNIILSGGQFFSNRFSIISYDKTCF
ncbi:unnamed protein product [Rotaria magnacalcarata]|uniref:Uncharacterized protein n=2 Tax=Rotaria magnacalcarata TaxID=392030 RepID=A0A816RPT6_9BILA|nr:unnamed protein product [Rotaria magnacalcarata]CAF1443191.1 unnamed protein product [Rotaria magnacalcarata]CAF2075945.1 unnamed protein product [Rotaria magnacalcarata]CAF2109086.1 unnamed protein product [Rotaria magnacalcarata]